MPPKKAKAPSKEEYDDLAMECEQQKRQAELAQEAGAGSSAHTRDREYVSPAGPAAASGGGGLDGISF